MWTIALTSKTKHRLKTTIAIVDDDPAVRDSVKMLLESYGWGTRTFASAEEFLNAYEPGHTGCIVLDMHMPGMNGVELQEQLKRKHTRIPIIVVTAYKEDLLIKRALQAGARAVIMKPFKDEDLLNNIEQALAEPG